MSQSNLRHVFSKLRVEVGPRRRFRNPLGPEGRLLKMRKTVTALVKHERLELFYHTGDESRGYAERLISEAIRHGENHRETMELASFWLLEKQLVHKLFKVLVPRYHDCKYSYTRMWKAPREYPGTGREKCILELRGNIYPNLGREKKLNYNLLHNKLIDEYRKEYEMEEKDKAKSRLTGGDRKAKEAMRDDGEESKNEESSSEGLTSDESNDSSPDGTSKGKNPSGLQGVTSSEDKRT